MALDLKTLLADMTLEEKIGQLTMTAGSYAVTGPIVGGDVEAAIRAGRIGSLLNLWGATEIAAIQKIAMEESRLGIPLIVGFDVLHGHRMIFPLPLAEACAFDPALWRATARAAAREAAADGVSMVFAPMLDVARDPRWGRIAEGAGEDPFVTCEFAKAKIAGFQGEDLAAPAAVAAVAKHFCAYGAAEGGRDYASADVSERALHEVYLPPFAAAIEAGCAAIMPAFMDLAGVPMTAHQPLLRGWLREARGFEGVIVSDYNALAELMRHGVAANLIEAAALALRAGVDIDMMSSAYADGLPQALARGLVTEEDIDACVHRVLELKQKLGLFDGVLRGARRQGRDSAEPALARDAARRSIVLLTNHGALPLSPSLRKIALIGPLSEAAGEMDGSWAAAGDRNAAVSILDGLTAALPTTEMFCAAGVAVDYGNAAGIADAMALCEEAELIILCLGESAEMSGEAASRADLGLPGRQRELAEAALGLGQKLGRPVVALLSSGRPLTLPWLFERADAVAATWFLGAEAGHAIADVLTGQFNPVGRLALSWPRAVGQIPLFYAARPTGRPFAAEDHYTTKYIDCAVEPQFPFGHGLSYSPFSLEEFAAGRQSFCARDTLDFSVEVHNLGPLDGEATVFLFARDLVASVARPVLELKRFGKIALPAGESGTLRFALAASELAFPGVDFRPCFEPGAFEFSVGFDADPRRHRKLSLQATAP
ncbi:glycoside hydrolase family 3 domain protein [Methylocella silvestris BL2]|uniref:beta-glucosidase n=1 Tax=Methylocella silvestris (strain DSM 15510 / CIP 108128 / LMG 27833 / NCIMB 13906 / BL2) TaxID=395965 RepID=B8EQW1_METSB|nr:glycoside hydrolase family 3 N-terminal domain-containing protein [Methylocella silvestris]ACK49382.1 glycoside hydrolase family 3 domain protein [Methylocella silvestris BL2]